MSGVPFLPVGVGLLIEWMLLGVVLMQVLITVKLHYFFRGAGGSGYHPDSMMLGSYVMMSLAFADVLYYSIHPDATWRIAPLVRFGLGTSIPWIHNVVVSFVRVIHAIWKVGVMLLGTIVIFAWLAMMLFDGLTQEDRYGLPLNQGFESFPNALYTMFVTMTTANLPDALVATYLHNSLYLLFWMPFLLLAVLFFSQIILASVYGEYQEQVSDYMKNGLRNRKKGIAATFHILKQNQTCLKTGEEQEVVRFPTFEQLVDVLWTFSRPEEIAQKGAVRIAFDAMDDNSDDVITTDEFSDMCDLMQMKFTMHERDSPIRRWLVDQELSSYALWLVDNGAEGPDLGYATSYPGSLLDSIMSCVLAANLVWIVLQSTFDINHIPECSWFLYVDLLFTNFYVIEVTLKLCWWSWREYWFVKDNRFDFVTTLILAVSVLLFITEIVDQQVIRYLNLLRMVRLLKGLALVPMFSRTCVVFGRMIDTCMDVLAMNFLVIYLWSSIGLTFFGGQLYESNPKFANQDLDYFNSHYQVYNFNDMLAALISCFFVMITSWIDPIAVVCMQLHERGTIMWFVSGGFWYFFYVASPLIAFNVFTAFSIDVYLKLEAHAQADSEEGGTGSLAEVRKNLHKVKEEYAQHTPAVVIHVEATKALATAMVFRELFDGDEMEEQLEDEGESSAPQGESELLGDDGHQSLLQMMISPERSRQTSTA